MEPEEPKGGEPQRLDYEAALAALDQVLARLEDGQVPLEEAIGLYERGVGLVRRCSLLLEGAERRVLELTGGTDGLPQERPLVEEPEEEPGAEGG